MTTPIGFYITWKVALGYLTATKIKVSCITRFVFLNTINFL